MWPFSSFNPPMRDWQGRSVWVVGASSGIGEALALALAERGARVTVSARRVPELQAIAATHPNISSLPVDVTDAPALAAAVQHMQAGPGLDVVVYAPGYYRAMRAGRMDVAELRRHWEVNVLGAQALAAQVLPLLLARGRGHWSVISSVAGYRGLPRSMAYGTCKAALTHWMETLVYDLRPHGVGLSVIEPGFVATPMTAGNDFHMPALITPEVAAQEILRGWGRGAFAIHFPKRLSRFLRVLRCLPDQAYFALVKRATGG